MGLSSIRLSLGSVLVFILFACSGRENKGNVNLQTVRTANDSCKLDLTDGRRLVNSLSCTNCHTVWDLAPRVRKEVPIFTEISSMDSLKLSDYVFRTKHNGMFIKDFPDAGKIIDSLSECEKNNLIHYIKDHNKSHVYP